MTAATTPALHTCQRCHFHKTRKPLCSECQTRDRREATKAAKRRAVFGTVANLGAEGFLAQLSTPGGFERLAIQSAKWRDDEPQHPGVRFTGHGGQTTIEIFIEDETAEYSPGSGHTRFTTSQGSFCYDRHGVEDSFYVGETDRIADVDAKVREQIARVAAARQRDLDSVKVPMVGHVVTQARRAELAAIFQAGGAYEFRPSGFGTGYLCSTRRAALGSFARLAPIEMASFFDVPALYYVTTDCD